MVNRFKVIAQRLASHGDAVLDKLRCLSQGQRVAFDGVRCVGQVNVIGFLQGEQRFARHRADRIQLRFFRGDRSEKLFHDVQQIAWAGACTNPKAGMVNGAQRTGVEQPSQFGAWCAEV